MYFSASTFIILLVVSPIAVIGDALSARSYIFRASNIANNQPLVNIGVIDFRQVGGSVLINGTIYGLAPGEHGFHVHDKGDIGNRCMASGAHFNPENKTHGAPTDSNRHVGDLGNVVADNSGTVRVDIEDTVVALHGPFSIIGRAVVVHEKRDDLGTGGTAASLTTGDAGNRLGCGVIGIFVN